MEQGEANSFIHSGYFYSASLSPLVLRSAPHTARILCQSFTPKHHRQLREGFAQVPYEAVRAGSNPRPFGQKTYNLPRSNHARQWSLLSHNVAIAIDLIISMILKIIVITKIIIKVFIIIMIIIISP